MARSAQQARKPKNKNKQKKKEGSEGEENQTQEDVEMKEETKDEIKEEEQSAESGNNIDGEETTEPEQTEEETKQTTEESKENSDFHKARRTLYIHFPPGPIGESGMEMLDSIYENNGKLSLPQQVCFAAFPSEEVVEKIKPKLEEIEINGQPLTVKYMGAKGTDMDDPCINPYRIKVQGLLVHPDEKLVARKFPKGKVTLTIKKLKSVTVDFNTKEDAAEALKSAKGLKFGEKPVRVSYVREASENWMEEFLKRKAEREAAESPSKKQKTDETQKEENNTEESSKEATDENEEEDLEDEGEDEDEGEEGEGEECEEAMEGEESEGEGGGDEDDEDDE